MKPFTKLTRAELADLITELRGDSVSIKQVRDNEARWGLKAARGIDLNKRVVRYDRVLALEALRSRGIIPTGNRLFPATS